MTGSGAPLNAYHMRELRAFRNALLAERSIAAAMVYLFGSAARGDILPFSDVDVAVVSPSFEGMPWGDRIALLSRMHGAWSPVSAIGVTEGELARRGNAYPSVLRSLAFRTPIEHIPGLRSA